MYGWEIKRNLMCVRAATRPDCDLGVKAFWEPQVVEIAVLLKQDRYYPLTVLNASHKRSIEAV